LSPFISANVCLNAFFAALLLQGHCVKAAVGIQENPV
jgi:hypothetical protein